MESKAKILIFEDEPSIAENLANYLRKLGYSEIDITCTKKAAAAQISRNFPDIALLDIHSSEDEEAGINLAKLIKSIKPVPIIYITAHHKKYKKKAFSTVPEAYIQKNIYPKLLDTTIELALRRLSESQGFDNENENLILLEDRIFFRESNKAYSKAEKKEIFYAEAIGGGCIEVYTKKGKFTSTATLKYLQEQLKDNSFRRLHRSFLVNILHIDSFSLEEKYVEVNNTKIPVSSAGHDFLSKELPRIFTKRKPEE